MLDNAAYHNPRGEDWTPVAKLNRSQLIERFDQLGISSFSAQRAVEVNGRETTI